MRFLGTLFGPDLADAYAGADVHVFPVRDIPNDPEGFGMVAAEAAAHSLPTVAYAAGGAVDAVADGVSGTLVPVGNAEAFADAALTLLRTPLETDAMATFARGLAWCEFGHQATEALLIAR